MEISYTAPLRRAWQRMKAMLFRPFHMERWLVMGFSAFLADILGTGGGLFGWNTDAPSRHSTSPRLEHAFDGAREQVMTLLSKPEVLVAIAIGLVVVAIVVLALAWASARARFVFLDNVVTGRGEFLEPWGRYGRLGRSLFLWCAAFSFAWLVPLALAAWPLAGTIASVIRGGEIVRPDILPAIMGVACAALAGLLLGFVSFLTRQFVVPLMLLHDETATRAWARFWPLFSAHAADFVAFTLFVAVVWLGVGVAVVMAGVATCCIGLALMLIPYVGTVLLLPLEVTARAYAPEFLAQYGAEWDLFAARSPRPSEPVDVAGPGGPVLG